MTYTAENIVSDEGLMVVRRRPTQYIPDLEEAGQTQLAYEIFDNAGDEALISPTVVPIQIILFRDLEQGLYQLAVMDQGRGIPHDALWRAFFRPHTSGKYNTEAYKYSSGTFGMGAKVTAALSHRFRVLSYRDGRVAHVHAEDGQPSCVDDPMTYIHPTSSPYQGTIVVYQPDPTVFLDVKSYAESGYLGILDRVHKYAFFHSHIPVTVTICEKLLPKTVWTKSPDDLIELFQTRQAKGLVMFDSTTFDRDQWIRTHFGIRKAFTWSLAFHKPPEKTNSLAYDIRLYYSKTEPGYTRLGMVNSVPIISAHSNHISEVQRHVMQVIASRIDDKLIRQYFMEIYKLPIYMAIEVKYEGAEFTGTTKHAFVSSAFREVYGPEVQAQLAAHHEAMDQLFQLIYPDIEARYLASLHAPVKQKSLTRLFQALKRPDKFADCRTRDRTQATLFLVEGDSAADRSHRDADTMGLYTIGGKPQNSLSRVTDLSQNKNQVFQNAIYADILNIITGLSMTKPDMNALYYNKIILMADAD